MLDLQRMRRIRLSSRPRVQEATATFILWPNFSLPPQVRIHLEGIENLPRSPVLFAMNHTDRFNYWPFQYKLWRTTKRFTATWVKGKYYENRVVGFFMEKTNNIPAVSRGYLIHRDFLSTMGRHATEQEYTALRQWVEAVALGELSLDAAHLASVVPEDILKRPRDMLGRYFDPAVERYAGCVNALFRAMTRQFVSLNGEALDRNLDLLVFPEGTRSLRLSRGHIGLAQIALYYKIPVVPVGCSGSDKLYPGNSPFAKGGQVVYRIGQPIHYDDMRQHHIGEPFEPFEPQTEAKHRQQFQGYVDEVMQRINALVDAPYQFGAHQTSQGVRGAQRFL